jgi:cytochrome c
MKVVTVALIAGALGISIAAGQEVLATSHGVMGKGTMGEGMMGQGLEMPAMDPARGRQLFASKGCVVCHSVNGVGGEDAPPLDASTMESRMNPFEFAAKMWRGAEAMIYLQREELGEQIELTGQELADIVAFTHHAEEQRKFSESDVPPRIRKLIGHMEEGEHHEDEGEHHEDKGSHESN